jgi:hypothetical protein
MRENQRSIAAIMVARLAAAVLAAVGPVQAARPA